jgi:hypothetical protein
MTVINHGDFFIVKYLLFFEKLGIPPILSSLAFGGMFLCIAAFFYFYGAAAFSLGYLLSLSWLSIGPFLIYKAGKMVDGLWFDMKTILNAEKVEELQSFEREFHSYRLLSVAVPLAVIASAASVLAILTSQELSHPLSHAFSIFLFCHG